MSTLDARQLGHLRHFDNLSRQFPNDWSLMQGKGTGQDDFGGYRFQLAYMAYALALTHRHRLPAAPGLFQPVMQRLIEKILLPEVWMYWRDVSRGGSVFNAHLAGELTEQWDPVARDNIMYSAYVQSMALLHDLLFDSDRYAAGGSLTFRHWSFFWGGGEKRFAYDRESLTEHIYRQLVENGYLGVACEPNCVFQICNQPAILGFRLHDLITGGHRAEEVVAGYERAWAGFGRLDEAGHYNMMVAEDSRVVRPNERPSPWVDAWCGALMNMWNRDFVHAHDRQRPAGIRPAERARRAVGPVQPAVGPGPLHRAGADRRGTGRRGQPGRGHRRRAAHPAAPPAGAAGRGDRHDLPGGRPGPLGGRGGRPGNGEDRKQFSRTRSRAATPHRAPSRRGGNPALRRAATCLHPAAGTVTRARRAGARPPRQ